MKAIVLAGGFAKRMWPLTKNKPKHLLPIAGKPMIETVLSELEAIGDFDKVFITTNAAFESQFKDFLESRDNKLDFELVIEPTSFEGEKLGPVGGIGKLIRDYNLDEPLFIIAGDNLFDSTLVNMIKHVDKFGANVFLLRNVVPELAHLYGIVSVDENDKVIDFVEKPDYPKSTLATTCCQVLTKEGVQSILKYLDEGNDPDKMGDFMKWLSSNSDVYGFIFMGKWFDIGSVEVYNEADAYFKQKGGM